MDESDHFVEQSDFKRKLKRLGRLLAVKPVLIIYGLQYAVTGPVTTQLWIDRTCRVNFGFNDSVCTNITHPEWKHFQDTVQSRVSHYNVVAGYIEHVPPIIISLYLGPLADKSRKMMMFIPYLGHILNGTFYLLFLHYSNLPSQWLWFSNIYTLFGGMTVLQIAMFAYIGDVTTPSERTTMISILAGLSYVIVPFAEFVSGQIFHAGGYYAVYGTSLGLTLLGMIYVPLMPSSMFKRSEESKEKSAGKSKNLFIRGNQSLIDSYKTLTKKRPAGLRKMIWALLLIILVNSTCRFDKSTQLYVEKKFGWSVTDYTNFISFYAVVVLIRTFIFTPLLSKVLNVHDCIISLSGAVTKMEQALVYGLATKGWHMYYGTGIMSLGGPEKAPLQAQLSKMVDTDEFGKIFTLFGVVSAIASTIATSGYQEIYADTVSTIPGMIFFVAAGVQVATLILVSMYYYAITKWERKNGELGSYQSYEHFGESRNK